ncbi:MAG TPA: tRNA (N6-isopentenyl adenosine(37)-C2)-methylthiotransferase MiaB [Oligoflexus sp.]|uniref:tRNA (N6-isopentenyl adenosine(37)-C2)-methylthiotransferase MiaB n=1 Tax=Oligoflexus sp. TaxID=1971216 RepID=UPI002D7E51B9|nr:tRNA (N6-isopentenyl adenosine(37)-C2)-methylthiotransferase MiaB [Oligoflexus sp.]HET9240543.1 tRNA (N6-isopentenyl adenosine(37)-C2)-methylthiotransferase MiaB [Oligoflexus sp.]
MSKKKVFVETWGCQMNVADSETMLSMLQSQNYETTDQVEQADLVLLNTCHIREKATHKVLSRLGALRQVAEHNPQMKIAVAGCVAQAEGEKLLEKATNIDILLGPGKIDQLPELLTRHEETSKTVSALGFKKGRGEDHPHAPVEASTTVKPTVTGKAEITRFVNIAQGCDNFCTFCVVPFTRGREISRPAAEIVAEVKTLLADGAREITLLGQNVNSYGHDLVRDGKLAETENGPFVNLLEEVVQLPGLDRLRFTTSNPHDFTKPLAELFRTYPKMGRYIHLPVQSGNDEVLERMKRKVTVAEYWERVRWLRAVDPEMALSTDLIVGFPGETDEQFEDTLKLVEAVRFSFIFAFKYSPRKGTAAARFREQVPEDVMSRRLAALNELQDRITLEMNLAEIGRTREVLCHYKSRKEDNVYYARTEQFRLVKIPAERDLVGKIFNVEIIDANKTALVGRLV